MRVHSRLKEDALERLAERLKPETPALLLIDYIETQSDFGELVENLNLLNDTGVTRIRYVATCRTGYYHQAIAVTSRHLPVDLSPPPGDAALDWFSSYRTETVKRILAKAEVPTTAQHFTLCRDLPILAVFLAYLHRAGRSEHLEELVSERDFGRWVSKRVRLSFPANDPSRELAMLVPLFPMQESRAGNLIAGRFGPVFDRLAADGWIEKVAPSPLNASGEWVAAHDVLADQILLSFLLGIPCTAEAFIGQLLSLAADSNCLGSALASLQRVADTPPLNKLPWSKLVTQSIATHIAQWREIRDLLIRTTLMGPQDTITLLCEHKELWVEAERDPGFQNALGWLARWLATSRSPVSEHHRLSLTSWLLKAAPFADKSNFVITWGLRYAPEVLQPCALHWISNRPGMFQTHYLLVAWLESKLPTQPIANAVQRWCQKHFYTPHLSFVTKAWLDAGGDKTLIEESVKRWLTVHKTHIDAQFVYRAWLDAGGDKAFIEEPLKEWLARHKTHTDAKFVYIPWLDAGGDKALIEEPLKAWLALHMTETVAHFVYKGWLDAGGDRAFIEEPLKEWLAIHKTKTDADFVYRGWLDAGGDKALIEGLVKEWLTLHMTETVAHFVYKGWLDAGGDRAFIEEPLKEWLALHKTETDADFVYRGWLDAGGDRAFIEEPLKEWLALHKTETDAQFVYRGWLDAGGDKALIEGPVKEWLTLHMTETDAQFVYRGWLDAGGDRAFIEEPLKEWLALHKTETGADFVYRGWLDAGGDRALIEGPLKEWLTLHMTETDAQFVYRGWLDAGGDRAFIEEPLKEWLALHKTETDAKFVYRGWLDAGGDKALIEEPLKEWLTLHKTETDAKFVYRGWLDVGGDKALIEEPLKEWLTLHKTETDAQFVYKGWLDAGGNKAFIEGPVKEWLALHKADADATFVYVAWLASGGERQVVWADLMLWLAEHQAMESAGFVYSAVAKLSGLPAETVREILAWCRGFPTFEHVLWPVTQLATNLLNVETLDDACTTAETLLLPIIASPDEVTELTRGQVTTLLCYLVDAASLHPGGMRDRIDTLIAVWMRHPSSFGRKPKPHAAIQRIKFARNILSLVRAREIDFERDRDSIKRFLEWVDEWDMHRKSSLHPTIEAFSKRYPAPELWNIVRFEAPLG